MKRKIIIIVLLLIIPFCFKYTTAFAKESSDESEKLQSEISKLIQSLDLSAFEEYLKSIPAQIIGSDDLKTQLFKILKGETELTFNSVSEYVVGVFFSGIKQKLPTFIALFILLLICSIINAVKSDKLGGSVYEIVRFSCFAVIVSIVVTVAYSLIYESKSAIENTSKAVQTVFPIILALMSVTGNSGSVAVYNPAMLFISDFVVVIVNKIIFPIILTMLAISVISNVCKTVKLGGLVGFSSGLIKWIIGLVATVFSIFLTVKGLNSGVYDGISLRALKYTINSSVPIVGGILRDGLDLVLASGVLVKNALGSVAIIIIFGIVIQPILEIACVSLALKLVNAVLEPLNDGQTSAFINSICSIISFAIAAIVLVALMYVVVVILSICSSQMLF